MAGAADPSLVEDSNNPVTPFFLTNGATSMDATSEIGASWFVLNTASNGLPNDDGRVLVMQVTTTGSIAGKVNVQVFPQGIGSEELRLTFPFSGAGTLKPGSMFQGARTTTPAITTHRPTWTTAVACSATAETRTQRATR